MKSVFSTLLVLCLAIPSFALTVDTPELAKRKGGGGGGGGGGGKGNGGGGAAGGLPLQANGNNPVCQPWYPIRDAIFNEVFQGGCNDLARASVRLAFHDAGTFSVAIANSNANPKPINGGADGSLLVDVEELGRSDNKGLQNIVAAIQGFPARFGVSEGDVLHLAGTLAVVTCPGGPQIKTFVGRPKFDPKKPNPHGLLPSPFASVPSLVALFADKTFDIRETVALLGAHSTGKQRFVDPNFAGDSFDSTVSTWDVLFYSETQANKTIPGVFRLQSDLGFSHHPTTIQDWNRFIGEQHDWQEKYAAAHEKMSLLGVDKNLLTDCTEIIPNTVQIGGN